MHPNTTRLFAIMEERELSRQDLAALLNCSLKTISCWRCESPRPIGARELERLELKLQIADLQRELDEAQAANQNGQGDRPWASDAVG